MLSGPMLNIHDLQKLVEPTLAYSQRLALSPSLRQLLEPIFGFKLDDVGIHTDATAQQATELLGARAFARGKEIYFGKGEDRFSASDGQGLLAHELTHIGQLPLSHKVLISKGGPGDIVSEEARAQDMETTISGMQSMPNSAGTLLSWEGFEFKVVNAQPVLWACPWDILSVIKLYVKFFLQSNLNKSPKLAGYIFYHDLDVGLPPQLFYIGKFEEKFDAMLRIAGGLASEIIKRLEEKMRLETEKRAQGPGGGLTREIKLAKKANQRMSLHNQITQTRKWLSGKIKANYSPADIIRRSQATMQYVKDKISRTTLLGWGWDIDKNEVYTSPDNGLWLFGYFDLYDKFTHNFIWNIHYEPIRFKYQKENYKIELWKGNYLHFNTGGEISVYKGGYKLLNKLPVSDEKATGCATQNAERLGISFKLMNKKSRNAKPLVERSDKSNWYTAGFKPFTRIPKEDLTMDIKITFRDEAMAKAFTGENNGEGLTELKYAFKRNKSNNEVSFTFDSPRTNQEYIGGYVKHVFKAAADKMRETLRKLTGDAREGKLKG